MTKKSLREMLPKYGYVGKIRLKLKEMMPPEIFEQKGQIFSRGYISNVVNGTVLKRKGKPDLIYTNPEITAAALLVAEDYKKANANLEEKLNEITEVE